MRQIVHARDILGLSWDRVSDFIDAYIAWKEGRSPRPRWNRNPWAKGVCHRWYRAAKAPQTSVSQDNGKQFRRCVACGLSKPVTEFAAHPNGRKQQYRRRECKPCRAAQLFRQRKAKRREAEKRASLAVALEQKRAELDAIRGASDDALHKAIRQYLLG